MVEVTDRLGDTMEQPLEQRNELWTLWAAEGKASCRNAPDLVAVREALVKAAMKVFHGDRENPRFIDQKPLEDLATLIAGSANPHLNSARAIEEQTHAVTERLTDALLGNADKAQQVAKDMAAAMRDKLTELKVGQNAARNGGRGA